MRSVIHPHPSRLASAPACITDSIAAPCAAVMPRSLQNATRWPCGIAIGTQQAKDAMHKIASTVLGRMPKSSRRRPASAKPNSPDGSGAGRRNNAAIGTAMTTTTANPTIVARQP